MTTECRLLILSGDHAVPAMICRILTFVTIQSLLARPRVKILAAHDPLRNVPTGNFTLADYSYDDADLCQNEFGNCALPNLGAKA